MIPASTRAAWAMLLPYLPEGSYLAGGTAIAVHLHHRVSRDLDFFTSEPIDTNHLVETLERSNLPFLLEREVRDRNIEITLESTKVEFTSAPANRLTEPTTVTAGVAVAGLGDLVAMKLAAIAKRRQIRDFEDIRAIELKGGRRIEEGLALALLGYRLRSEDALLPMVAALGGVSECPPDPLVVTDRQVLADYFEQRLPEVWYRSAGGMRPPLRPTSQQRSPGCSARPWSRTPRRDSRAAATCTGLRSFTQTRAPRHEFFPRRLQPVHGSARRRADPGAAASVRPIH